MKCPRCDANNYSKNGFHKGKQKYICKCCGRQWLANPANRGYPKPVRELCLTMCRNGLGIREISQYTGISYNTIMNWVKQARHFDELLLDPTETPENTEARQVRRFIT